MGRLLGLWPGRRLFLRAVCGAVDPAVNDLGSDHHNDGPAAVVDRAGFDHDDDHYRGSEGHGLRLPLHRQERQLRPPS
ncbi:MAG: hypothetical protein ACXV4D_05610, partial [Ilumatobacteraceae bacterium]